MPTVTEARCRACVMTGGCVVETDEEAAAMSALLLREVEVGAALSEEPCVPTDWLEQYERKGQACPRVPLAWGNDVAAEALTLAMSPHTAWLAPQTLAAAELPAELHAAVLRRVAYVLRDQAVAEKVAPAFRGGILG
jgi:hypothetical protein